MKLLKYQILSLTRNVEHSSAEYNLDLLNTLPFWGKQSVFPVNTKGSANRTCPMRKVDDISEKDLLIIVLVKQHHMHCFSVTTGYLLSCLLSDSVISHATVKADYRQSEI